MATLRNGGQGPYDLDGKVAVITGASGGIGAAAARLFADGGARVAVGYNSGQARAASVAASLAGKDHLAVRIPMEDSRAIASAAGEIEARLGRADILVNCAGATRAVPHSNLDALDDDTFDSILRVNVRGPFATIRAFAPLLRRSGDGIVINVSSISATTGLGSNIAYCASKAALDTMGLSLARVLAPEIRVIGVAPAAVATDFVPGRGREGLEKQAASTPLKTIAEPDDVAWAIFAAVVNFRLTTGSTFVVDGGRHL